VVEVDAVVEKKRGDELKEGKYPVGRDCVIIGSLSVPETPAVW
jgi:hypothetical protein